MDAGEFRETTPERSFRVRCEHVECYWPWVEALRSDVFSEDDFVTVKHQVDVCDGPLAIGDADARTVGEVDRANQAIPCDQQRVLARNKQVAFGAKNAAPDQHWTQFRMCEQLCTGDRAPPDPSDFLWSVVEGADQIADVEVFDQDITLGRADGCSGGEADDAQG